MEHDQLAGNALFKPGGKALTTVNKVEAEAMADMWGRLQRPGHRNPMESMDPSELTQQLKEKYIPERFRSRYSKAIRTSKAGTKAIKEQYAAAGKPGQLKWEAQMQKEAHLERPDIVPDMYGTTKEGGFLSEYGGRGLNKNDPQEMTRAFDFLEKESKRFSNVKGDAQILHMDLHPDNVVVGAAGEFKLIDFGLSMRATQTRANIRTRIGGWGEALKKNVELGRAKDIPKQTSQVSSQRAGVMNTGAVGDSTAVVDTRAIGNTTAVVDTSAIGNTTAVVDTSHLKKAVLPPSAPQAAQRKSVLKRDKKKRYGDLTRQASQMNSTNGLRAGRRSKSNFVASRSALPKHARSKLTVRSNNPWKNK